MDSKLKGTVIALVTLLMLTVIAIVGVANADALKKKKYIKSSSTEAEIPVSDSKENSSLMLGNSPYEWMKDNNFFDSEEKNHVAKLMEDMMTLHMEAISVEKDIRIKVLNYSDHLQTGEKFEITITPESGRAFTLMDSDKDGILTVDDLKPGDYSISLLDIEGYIVPDASTDVAVKDKVDYQAIDDSFLVINEETKEISENEDTMLLSAESEVSKQTNKSIKKGDNHKCGIDVSSKDGDIDWEEVASQEIDFAFVRTGYRGTDTGILVEDSNFDKNARLAASTGMDVGVYFYSQAVNEKEAVEEASFVLDRIRSLLITYPIVLRMDASSKTSRTETLTAEQRTEIAKAFCETVKSEGYDAFVYASDAWLLTNLEADKLEKYGIYLAEYTDTPKEKDYYFDLWQYTSEGKVSGIEGNVSLSLSYMY